MRFLLALPFFVIASATSEGPLLLTGKLWYPEVLRGEGDAQIVGFVVGNKTIEVGQDTSIHTGGYLWDCSLVLTKYLERHLTSKYCMDGSCFVLELGSGVGLASLGVSALLGATPRTGHTVIASDIPALLPVLRKNVWLNSHHNFSSPPIPLELDWFNSTHCKQLVATHGYPDLVVGADIIWLPQLIDPLVSTLACLAADTRNKTSILIAYQERSALSTRSFFQAMSDAGFHRERIDENDLHPEYSDRIISVYAFHRTR